MRRLLTTLVVAGLTTLLPLAARAGNQEVAESIAHNIKASGQLHGYHIAVKFEDGTAWLTGRVTSAQQVGAAMKLAFSTKGVARVINQLEVVSNATPAAPKPLPIAANREIQPTAGAEGPGLLPQPARTARAAVKPRSGVPGRPIPVGMHQPLGPTDPLAAQGAAPQPMYGPPAAGAVAPMRYDQPCLPNYAWPSYAAYPNYAAVSYPKQYAPTAWPYIGPFYPYPQVPLGWRKVTLEWDDGWWFLDFKDDPAKCFSR